MNKTQKTYFAVLTALTVCGLVFAALAVKATVAWVIAWVITIIFTLAWVLGFFAHVSNKGKKVVWQSIIGLILLITYIVLLMGGMVRVGKTEPETTTTTTTNVEETTEATTVAPEVTIDDEVETTTKKQSASTTSKVETTTKKQSASTTSKVETTTKKQSASTTSKVETTTKKQSTPSTTVKVETTTKHTHSYSTTVTAAKTTYEVASNGHYKVTTAAVKKCSCGATTGGEVSKKFESHSYNGGKCACGEVKETTTAHTHSYSTTVTAAKTTYEKTSDGHYKVVTAAVKKCSCGATTGGEVSKKFESHSYNGGKCSCGAVEPRIVLKARDTSEKTGYLRVTPEDTVSIIIYGVEDINEISYTWDGDDGKSHKNEGITFRYVGEDGKGGKLYTMRLSEEMFRTSLDISFYPQGSSNPVVLTSEWEYD